ncbi:MAG: F0F1 ATP synthase subunit delta [Verrucomicrobia bacterium]|nr:F0F1 ATP synthase subunit delta [Verrucomicrobiota bacterium]
MKISKQARRDAKELFRSCCVDGLLDENRARQAVQQVVQRKPRGYVAILSHFQRLVKLEVARRTAKVESAVALLESSQASVRANLNRLYGAGLSLTFAQNPALIGGMRVQVGSDVYDGSIWARLAALKESV